MNCDTRRYIVCVIFLLLVIEALEDRAVDKLWTEKKSLSGYLLAVLAVSVERQTLFDTWFF